MAAMHGTRTTDENRDAKVGWSLPMHAAAMLTACGVAAVLLHRWPLVVGAGLSFSGLVASSPRRWTPSGRFGPANAVTAGRLVLVLGLATSAQHLRSSVLAAGFIVALLLDVVDGFLARRLGDASEFGASFDMEVDAGFVLFIGYLLWQRNGLGPWVLAAGVLRYVYVLCLVLLPPSGIDCKRSRFGRVAFVASASCLLLALAIPGIVASLAAGLATAVACLSFGRSFVAAYPSLGNLPALGAKWVRRAWTFAGPTFLFLACSTFLNVVVNVRYPAREPAGWYFLPSLDITVLITALALVGLTGLRLPRGWRIPLVVWLLVVRMLRIGDGVAGQYFSRAFNLYIDLPLASDLVRYARSTMDAWKLVMGALVAVFAIVVGVVAISRALTFIARYFERRSHILLFAALALPFAATSLFLRHDERYVQRYAGAFGASSLPRLSREATFLMNVYSHQAREAKAIASVQEVLRRTPTRLERLHRANVLLLFVESYGATVVSKPEFVDRSVPALRAMEADLAKRGFASASGLLTSATYGGMSWLAHATLMTGVRTTNQMEYDLLGVHRPRSMAKIFHEAGYRTVLVEPNTERQSSGTDFYDFDVTYRKWNFDYVGPPFAWATMPDQYVLDFVRRREVDVNTEPLFAAYVLVSSHAPWSRIPTPVLDWSQVSNGAIYHAHPLKRADLNWPDFSLAGGPYLTSILYDLEILRDYITRFVRDDSLIVVLGDHQPVSEVTGNSPAWEVPVHVISRDSALVAPFLSRGYAHGMVPGNAIAPMETFLVDFLRDFSGGAS